jgi:hypothetical protein
MVRNTTDGVDLLTAATIPQSAEYGSDLIPVTEGFRVLAVQPNDGDGGVYSLTQTTDVTPDSAYTVYFSQAYMEAAGSSANRANRTGLMNTLEYRFTGFYPSAGDTNWAYDIYSGMVECPYELWDIEDNVRLMPLLYEWEGGGRWVSDDYNVATTMTYFLSGTSGPLTDPDVVHPDATYWGYNTSNPASRSDWAYRWAFSEYDLNDAGWTVGDVWTLVPYKVVKGYDGQSFTFSTTAPATEDTLIDYDDIQPVPNPYYIMAEWDRNINRRKIMFTNVPANSTIDIYTLNGEMVASLDHSGSALDDVGTRGYNSDRIGTVTWNLWTYEYTEAAYGLYIYVVKVGDDVKKVGKLAIIR